VEKKYSIAQARQQLSAIVREAERAGAVRITRSGQVVARLVSEREFLRLARRKRRIDWGTMLIDTRRDVEVRDLNNDGVSEVVAASLGSGGGSTIGEKCIVQFQGWTPIVLHRVKFEDNEGTWGIRDNRYFSRSVSWEFTDLDNDGNADLVEEVITQKGRNNRDPIITKVRRKFLFKNNRFVRYAD